MGKQSGLAKRMTDMFKRGFADGQRLGQQQVFDAVTVYLHRNGWGATRIIRMSEGVNNILEQYADAFRPSMEQDVMQERMDGEIQDALKGAAEFTPFCKRYPEIKTAGYEKLPKD